MKTKSINFFKPTTTQTTANHKQKVKIGDKNTTHMTHDTRHKFDKLKFAQQPKRISDFNFYFVFFFCEIYEWTHKYKSMRIWWDYNASRTSL